MMSGAMIDDWIGTFERSNHSIIVHPIIDSRSSGHRFVSLHHLPRRAPRKPVGRTSQLDHQGSELTGHAGRTSDDDHFIADLERLSSDALIGQLSSAAPLDSPPLFQAVFIWSLEVHEGMRVAVDELHQLPLKLDLFVDVVGGAVGMVRPRCGSGHYREQHERACGSHHYFFS